VTTEPKSPFPRRVERTLLGALSEPMGSPGQCLAVYRLLDHPGWLYKAYRPEQLREADELRLSRLIALPDKLTSADRLLLSGHSCWPRSQVLDGRRTVGVLIPEAPARYFARLRSPDGTSERGALLLTQLAATEDSFQRVGLTTPTLAQRLTACEGLIRIGDLLERHGLVYGDWGYKNIFWSQDDHSVYFIDVDACSFGSQPWVESFGFADPFTPDGQPVDTFTERFRCAIAVAACLTGNRAPAKAISGLAQLSGDDRIYRLAPILRQIAACPTRSDRLPIAELRKALSPLAAGNSAATPLKNDGTNIISWEPVEPAPARGQSAARNRTSATRQPSGNAARPAAGPPGRQGSKTTSTANAFSNSSTASGATSNSSSTSTSGAQPTAAPTRTVTPQRGSSYAAASQYPTTPTRTGNASSAAPTLAYATYRYQERRRRIVLLVCVIALLLVAGLVALLVT
jgi:hypothetical protein